MRGRCIAYGAPAFVHVQPVFLDGMHIALCLAHTGHTSVCRSLCFAVLCFSRSSGFMSLCLAIGNHTLCGSTALCLSWPSSDQPCHHGYPAAVVPAVLQTLLLTQPCCSLMTASWDWTCPLVDTSLMVTTLVTRRSVPHPSTSRACPTSSTQRQVCSTTMSAGLVMSLAILQVLQLVCLGMHCSLRVGVQQQVPY